MLDTGYWMLDAGCVGLEEDPAAVRVPFFHRNTDYDEFIFYHDGNFFSRDNIKAGMVTLHPRGIHHGPHPKALAGQKNKTHTDEYAVMLDGLNPIDVLPAGMKLLLDRGADVAEMDDGGYTAMHLFCFPFKPAIVDRDRTSALLMKSLQRARGLTNSKSDWDMGETRPAEDRWQAG